jgi:hypothetical protein
VPKQQCFTTTLITMMTNSISVNNSKRTSSMVLPPSSVVMVVVTIRGQKLPQNKWQILNDDFSRGPHTDQYSGYDDTAASNTVIHETLAWAWCSTVAYYWSLDGENPYKCNMLLCTFKYHHHIHQSQECWLGILILSAEDLSVTKDLPPTLLAPLMHLNNG